MRRDTNLRTLSWEHHDGLVLAFRIERGLQNGTDPELIRTYVANAWDEDLSHHFWQEESILPQILKRSSEGKKLLEKLLRDHNRFREMISDLAEAGDIAPQLRAFGKHLNEHIRFEERQLFPFVEEHAGAQDLKELGAFLSEHHQQKKSCWEPAFWREGNREQ
jgi:hemerythrin-like domain-containing protein